MPTMTTRAPTTATRRDRLTLSTDWLSSTVVRISASGDIDAANTAEVLDYVLHRGANCRSLILDFKDVTFFAAAGFSILQTIDAFSSSASVSWMVVPGASVSRVLSICDHVARSPAESSDSLYRHRRVRPDQVVGAPVVVVGVEREYADSSSSDS